MHDDPITRLLAQLPSARQHGHHWQAQCPSHDDRHASLSLTVAADGRVLLKCHAGCTAETIVTALGLTLQDLFPTASRPAADAEAVYTYRDEQQVVLFEVVRFPGKKFLQRRPNGVGGWTWNLNGTRRVLYRLPELVGHETVFVTEGEKDVETLWRAGLAATTNPHGAGKWRDEYVDQLQAAGCQRVVMLPDNDPPGAEHARVVARSCQAGGLAVIVVALDGLLAKGDVTDYLQTHSKDQLLAAVRVAPSFDAHALPLTTIGDLLAEPDDLVDWLVTGRIPMGSVCLIASKPKVGKTTTARHLALAVARGETWLDGDCCPGSVWYLAFEGRRQDHKTHFRRMGATAADPIWVYVGQAGKNIVADVRARAAQERPRLIIIDTLQRFIKASSMDDYAEITTLFDLVLDIARASGAVLVLLHHAGKADRASLDAVLGSTAITGSVDNIFVLARTKHYRTICTIQRIGEDLEERVLELNEVTGRVRLGPTRETKDRQVLAQALYDALDHAGSPLTQPAWFDLVEGRRTTKLAAIKDLLGSDAVWGTRITRSGAGTRNDPYRYAIVVPAVSSSLVPLQGGNQKLFSSSSTEITNRQAGNTSSRVPAQDPLIEPVAGTPVFTGNQYVDPTRETQDETLPTDISGESVGDETGPGERFDL